jgi:hypothetical protein
MLTRELRRRAAAELLLCHEPDLGEMEPALPLVLVQEALAGDAAPDATAALVAGTYLAMAQGMQDYSNAQMRGCVEMIGRLHATVVEKNAVILANSNTILQLQAQVDGTVNTTSFLISDMQAKEGRRHTALCEKLSVVDSNRAALAITLHETETSKALLEAEVAEQCHQLNQLKRGYDVVMQQLHAAHDETQSIKREYAKALQDEKNDNRDKRRKLHLALASETELRISELTAVYKTWTETTPPAAAAALSAAAAAEPAAAAAPPLAGLPAIYASPVRLHFIGLGVHFNVVQLHNLSLYGGPNFLPAHVAFDHERCASGFFSWIKENRASLFVMACAVGIPPESSNIVNAADARLREHVLDDSSVMVSNKVNNAFYVYLPSYISTHFVQKVLPLAVACTINGAATAAMLRIVDV